ncbi:DNA-binding domain-containing protein, AraC-type [Desulfosporosinus acidiphilus SJ4]|uniref:DNA-binding domain-containing protein, AraC-type n=1 Tax=Desulfosporosinus acidiphilus (strain DSM 22704 / JCM 16185 / SJ4) TaxID=646529 RepID=I4D6I0_DESAJ|nr:DNA-binding domain-containing protein, AraC-type [Desulfosporosinus acidiphilus SJ4]
MNANNHSILPAPDNTEKSIEAEMARLSRLLLTVAPYDGVRPLPISGLYVARYSSINVDCIKTLYLPSLGIVAQGAKSITVGQETYQIEKSQMLMHPVALPVALKAIKASKAEPLLAVRLDLSPQRIAELVLKVYPHGLPPIRQWSAGYVVNADVSFVNAVTRLLECLEKPGDVELLSPLIMDEILIRLLRSPIGIHVAEMGFADSDVHQVAEAIAWLRENYSQSVKVTDLAELTHMSVSSFHDHFKAVTSMTPMQYQKALRLQEARRLMLSREMDATTACRIVGYVSNSQFSRDYSVFFGASPRRDIARLRQQSQRSE